MMRRKGRRNAMKCWMLPLFAAALAAAAPPPVPVAEPEAETHLDTAEDRFDRMTVDVMIDGKGPFKFAVDTGSDRTVISAGLAQRLGLGTGRNVTLHGMAGVDRVSTATARTLTVGGRTIRDVEMPVLSRYGIGADGLLGIDALAGQSVEMDFRKNRMTVRANRRTLDADSDEEIVVTARRRFGQLVLANASVDGKKVYAIIDSGAQTSVGNFPLRKKLAGAGRYVGQPTELVSVTGRSIPAELALSPKMRIGGITLENVTIAYSEAHPFGKFGLSDRPAMLVGTDILRLFKRVTVDFDRKEVRFVVGNSEIRAGTQQRAAVE
jgi:predicted aspartyl protease